MGTLGSVYLCLALIAHSIDIQRVVLSYEPPVSCRFHSLFDVGINKLTDRPTDRTDHVVMRFHSHALLVLDAVAHQIPHHQSRLCKEIEVAVHGCPTHTEYVPHVFVQLVGSEMTVIFIYSLQQMEPLWSLPEFLVCYVCCQNLFCLFIEIHC